MKRRLGVALLLAGLWAFTGCGVNSSNNSGEGSKPVVYGKAVLGNLANATVKIYEVGENGTLTLKWTEKTSSGNDLDEIGNFNTHANELNPEKFYLYRVEGGCDWDADDDGVMDDNCTENRGVIRAIARGSDIKEAGEDFRVSLVSEIVYEKVAKYLKYYFDEKTFGEEIEKALEPVIEDIDGDGEETVKDVLVFNPVKDREKLEGIYKIRYFDGVGLTHSGKFVMASSVFKPQIVSNVDTPDDAIGVALSSDGKYAFVADGGGLRIVDVSDPQNPVIVSNVDTPGDANGVALSSDGKLTFVADGYAGLEIIDPYLFN